MSLSSPERNALCPGRRTPGRPISGLTRAVLPVAVFLLVLGVATPASSQCVATQLDGGPTDPVSSGATAMLSSVGADGESLVLDLDYAGVETFARLHLLGPGDRLLAERDIVLSSARQQVRLDGVLARGRPLQMRVRVETLADDTLIDEPVRLRLDCRGGRCRWQMQRDLAADGAVVESRVIEAMENLRTSGRDDALAVLWDNEPSLRGGLAELALAWQDDQVFEGPGGQPGDDLTQPGRGACGCHWVAIQDRSIKVASGHPAGSRPLHVRQDWSGVDGSWAAQMSAFDYTASVGPFHTTLGYELVCGKLRGVEPRKVKIDGRSEPIRLPILEPCSASCSPVVHHEASVDLCLGAKAYGQPTNAADAQLQWTAAIWIDQALAAATSMADQLSTRDPSGESFHQVGGPAVSRSIFERRSTVTLRVGADAALAIEGLSNPQPYVFASLAARARARIEASCGSRPTAVLFHGTDHGAGGGKVLVRWGDPP